MLQGSEYASGSEYTSGSEYAWARLNMLKSVRIDFILYFLIVIPCLLERMVTYFNVYTKLEVFVWKKTRMLTWRNKILIFSIVAASILFGFYFKLYISTIKISNILLFLGADRGWGLWFLIDLILVYFYS